MTSRRERLLAEGMRLFGQKGYAATSVAEIEEAAGLSRGSGNLYRHFASKRDLLQAGIDALLAARDLSDRVTQPPTAAKDATLLALAQHGLSRMEEDRDLNRLLFHSLERFPQLARRFADEEINQQHRNLTQLLAAMAAEAEEQDWQAVACVVQSAVAHYWLLTDVFGTHPTQVDKDAYVAATIRMSLPLVAHIQRPK
jgi:AcrR family transcriptional regulator